MRKGEIACNKQFLLFSQCFLPYMVLIFHSICTLTLSSIYTHFHLHNEGVIPMLIFDLVYTNSTLTHISQLIFQDH